MKKAGIKHWTLTALCCIVMSSLVQGVNAKRSISAILPVDIAVDGPNLNSEVQTIDSFNDDLTNYNKKGVELSKKSTLLNEEFNSLERTGNDLKRRVSQVKDATQSIISKLKAAGRWNTLDDEVLAKLTDANDRAFVQKMGGLRRIFEDAVTQLDSQAADEIVTPLSHLRAKVAALRFDDSQALRWRMVTAGYSPSTYVPADRRSARCIGATIRYAAHIIVSNNAAPNLSSNMHCYCDGGSKCQPGNTSIMVW